MLQRVYAPHLNAHVVLGGRLPPRVIHPHLKLSRYMNLSILPSSPASADYGAKAQASLRNIFLNNQLGDCVIASGYHIEGVATGNATGVPFIATGQQIINDYHYIGNYIPGNPATDQGCEIQTALAYWSSHGFANGTKLMGYMSVDASNQVEVATAIWLFENMDFGVGLPNPWVSPLPSADGFVWGSGTPDLNNGHSFCAFGYNKDGVPVDTWALEGLFTWSGLATTAVPRVGGEAWVLLTPDIINKAQQKAPNGFDWSALISDWNAMGGHVMPPPAPVPVPVPTPPSPAPVAGPALTQTQVVSLLHNSWPK